MARRLDPVEGAAPARRGSAVDHPVAACPDADEHLRALDRAERIQREVTELTQRIDRQAGTLVRTVREHPWTIEGPGRPDTVAIERLGVFAKTGAEGVFGAALPEHGLGIALKCEDGATRAAEAMIAAVLMRYFADDAEVTAALEAMANRTLINWNGTEVGAVKAVLPH